MKIDVFEAKSSQDGSWGDLGSIWVAKRGRLGRPLEGQVGSKKGRKSDAKKGLVLAWFWVTLGPIVVGSLGAGSNKGETEQHLPFRLQSLHVVLSLSCLCLVLVFVICFLHVSCLCLRLVPLFVFAFALSLSLSCLVFVLCLSLAFVLSLSCLCFVTALFLFCPRLCCVCLCFISVFAFGG